MAKRVKKIEEKLGQDAVEDLLEKPWKVIPPPSAEELAQEEPSSPKARNNPNSRKNLAQYNKRSRQSKEAALENLKFTEVEEDVDPAAFFPPEFDSSVFEKILPAREIFVNRAEQTTYYTIISLFFKDINPSDLTFSDIDDIITLAVNKVLENRLLKASATNERRVIDVSPTLERFRKHSDKVKSNLASRRVDRVDAKYRPTFSIVDLAAKIDTDDDMDFRRRVEQLEREDKEYRPPTRDDDIDPGGDHGRG